MVKCDLEKHIRIHVKSLHKCQLSDWNDFCNNIFVSLSIDWRKAI